MHVQPLHLRRRILHDIAVIGENSQQRLLRAEHFDQALDEARVALFRHVGFERHVAEGGFGRDVDVEVEVGLVVAIGVGKEDAVAGVAARVEKVGVD